LENQRNDLNTLRADFGSLADPHFDKLLQSTHSGTSKNTIGGGISEVDVDGKG
jgi:hypothetical protein